MSVEVSSSSARLRAEAFDTVEPLLQVVPEPVHNLGIPALRLLADNDLRIDGPVEKRKLPGNGQSRSRLRLRDPGSDLLQKLGATLRDGDGGQLRHGFECCHTL